MRSFVMVRWQEDGVWHYLATDSQEMLERLAQIVGEFEYV